MHSLTLAPSKMKFHLSFMENYFSFFSSVFDPTATYEQFTQAEYDENVFSVLQLYEIYCVGICVNVTV